jgi:hypothetical protein
MYEVFCAHQIEPVTALARRLSTEMSTANDSSQPEAVTDVGGAADCYWPTAVTLRNRIQIIVENHHLAETSSKQ